MKNPFPKLFKARDKPANSLNGSGYSFLFGPTVAGKAVNERSAMQMSAVYACVRILHPCHCTFTSTTAQAERKRPCSTRFTVCFMTNRTRRCRLTLSGKRS